MGCWNKTCGLTRLHIHSGTPVYVFALQQVMSHERCYATAFWKPCLIPWTAEYNDHGAGEENTGVGLDLVMEGVGRQLIEMEQGENRFHDIPVKREGFNVEAFYEAVHEGRLRVKNFMGSEAEVDFVMMRKDCVDDLLNTWRIEDCRLNRDTNDLEYYSYDYDDIVDEIPVFLEELKEYLANATEMDLILGGVDRVTRKSKTKLLAKFLETDSVRFSSFVHLGKELFDMAKEERLDRANLLLQDYLKGVMLNMLFEVTRRNWAPGGHEGSQCDELDAQELILDVTKEAISRERARYEEDEDD